MKITFALLAAVVAVAAVGLHCGPAVPEPLAPEGVPSAAPTAPAAPDVDAAAPAEQPK